MSSVYSYRHHIIPRHEWKKRFGNLIGFNALDNIVWFTLDQHIQVHKRMGDEGSKFDKIAYQRMSGQIGHEEAQRKAASVANAGRVHTEKTRKKMSEAKIGNKINLGKQNGLGTKRTEEYKLAQSRRKLDFYANLRATRQTTSLTETT